MTRDTPIRAAAAESNGEPGMEAAPAGRNSAWGGRFAGGPDALMLRINASIDFDRRLFREDIAGSVAHCRMLVAQRILTEADGKAILNGLDKILREIEAGQLEVDPAKEDIHMHVEARLKDLIGAPAGRLHTARSRNDQVATDLRLWLRAAIDRLDEGLAALQTALVDQADRHAETVMPGFTHLQTAQPVTFGHHMLAYAEMIGRDRGRFADARARLNECPLGAAALAGTSFPIDRQMTARELGFAQPMANSLDAVSDRDFALEYLAAGAILAMHLSRLAEEVVIWSSAQFRFLQPGDAFTSGSSIMPQKRNPDAAELLRAKSGRVIGALNTLLVVMKGLPLAYGKDMQEDKEPVFDAAETLEVCTAVAIGIVGDLTPNAARLREAAGSGFSTATDLADWLVRELGLPFREAHHVTGSLVRAAEDSGCGLEDLPLEVFTRTDGRIHDGVYQVLGVDNSVRSRTSHGGTAPDQVRRQVAQWRSRLAQERKIPE